MAARSGTENNASRREDRSFPPAAVLLHLFIFSVLSYFLFEYTTGNLFIIPLRNAVWNVLWIFVLYAAVFSLTGSSRFALPCVSVPLFLLSVAETFVMRFRGSPIRIWDILALPTAMTVAGQYTFSVSHQMVLSAVILAAALVLAWRFPVRIRTGKRRLLLCALGISFSSAFTAVFYLLFLPHSGIEINMWDADITYSRYGYCFSTAVSVKYMFTDAPAGYSRRRVQELAEELSAGTAEEPAGGIQPTNLICIMNEILSDLHVAGDFSTNEDYFPFINGITENAVTGSLCVPVFGSMTPNSEYEFLTGDSMHLFPSFVVPYQLYISPGMDSLVSTLKSQGYSAVSMHPYSGNNWNRNAVYRHLGFDLFLDESFFTDGPWLRAYISDQADFERIIRVVETKTAPEEKMFIFNVTMQNHGGYEPSSGTFDETIRLTGDLEGKYPQTDRYLSLMRESDRAFEYLIDYFKDCEQPTMIVMFGDHQPCVENDFYDAILGKPSSEASPEESLIWYQTPFIIWTNYEQPSARIDRLGAVYLSSLVLRLANLKLTPYNRYLLDMAQELPVVHPTGCVASDGTFYSWNQLEDEASPYYQLITSYEYMAYDHVLDGERQRDLFTVTPR